MTVKSILLVLSLTSLLNASCSYNLNIKFDFKNKKIDVKTRIFDSKKSLSLDIKKFEIKDKSFIEESLNNGSNNVTFTYTKKIDKLNENFIYLLDDWYPQSQNRCVYKVDTNLPKTYKSIYENTSNEVDHISFISSDKFIVNSKAYNNINIKTYFLKDNPELSLKYQNKSIEYIKLYEKKIGKYPYTEFKIVENIYQTGYSMPTFTLIGSRLLNKDYVLNQSLGHEILHQYFGNSIFNDFQKGNWVEGLTTYLADDYYKRLANEDINHRKSILSEYSDFVNEKNEFALKDFEHRHDKPSMLIGYSKMSFVFHMLEKKIGSEKFNDIIKKLYLTYKFEEINLHKLGRFFDNNTKIDLREFFEQWFDKKGKINFDIKNLNNYYDKDGFWLSFDLIQNEKNFYKFDLPISIKTYDEKITKIINITQVKQTVKLNFSSEIFEVILDENVDLFRTLTKDEKNLSISSLMVQNSLIAVVNKNDAEKYEFIKNILPMAKIVYSSELKFQDIKDNSIVFLDFDNDLLKNFFPNNRDNNETYLSVKKHTYNDTKIMAVLNYGMYKQRYFSMLHHFSKYKEIILSKNKITKNIDKTSTGIRIKFGELPTVSKIEKKDDIKSIYNDIKDKRIIYVGESHTNFSHHLNQLRVIKTLHENDKNVAIAMEMFQAPFQKYIDEYIAGRTTLNDFLRDTEYYKRWKFDYNLYKPIIDYAKLHKIPIVAINIDREITKKVSKEGLFSLTKNQKKVLPKEIDQSNLEYKDSLSNIFKEHSSDPHKNIKSSKEKKDNVKAQKDHPKMPTMNLDYFYQSQLIWDEIMAENIDNYIKLNNDITVVVVAGAGHIQKHSGIPSRVFRRNSLPYKVILNDFATPLNGDILLINQAITKQTEQKKLGVYLKNNDELIVMRIVEKSFSSKIDIRKNDKIIELNDIKVENLYDLKRALYFVNDINKSKVKVKRDGKILELSIK